MVKYGTFEEKHRKSFDSVEDLLNNIAIYGSKRFDGNNIQYQVYCNDIQKLKDLQNIEEDVLVITTQQNIAVLSNFCEDKHFNPTKRDIIISVGVENNIQFENDKVIRMLVKVLPTKDIANCLYDLGLKCNNQITEEVVKSTYFVDNTVHPVNVLKAVLQNRGYKSYLANCRKVYNDAGIRTGMLNHLYKALEILQTEYSGVQVKHNQISRFGLDSVSYLVYLLNNDKILDRALRRFYGREKNRSF